MNNAYKNELTCNCVLIILPGRHNREHVLKRIKDYCKNIAILVDNNNSSHAEWAKKYANYWIECNTNYNDINNSFYDAICNFRKQNESLYITGCFTYDDYGIEPTSFICDRLHVQYHSIDTVQKVRNKHEFRKVLQNLNICGIKNCRNFIIHDLEELDSVLFENTITYPVILKPAIGCGKHYVSKINTEEQLRIKFNYYNSHRVENQTNNFNYVTAGWIIEDYCIGHEVDIDGYAIDNQVIWMHVADNKPVDMYIRETGGYYPSQLSPDLIEIVKNITKQCLEGIGGIHGCFHFEALVDLDNKMIIPIELNLRVGGAECPIAVEAVTGVYLPIIACCIAMNMKIPEPLSCYYYSKSIVTTINIYAHNSGIIESCCGTQELYEDSDFIGAVFYQTKNTKFIIGQGSMSLLCWIAVKGITKTDADENLQRCIKFCKLNVINNQETI